MTIALLDRLVQYFAQDAALIAILGADVEYTHGWPRTREEIQPPRVFFVRTYMDADETESDEKLNKWANFVASLSVVHANPLAVAQAVDRMQQMTRGLYEITASSVILGEIEFLGGEQWSDPALAAVNAYGFTISIRFANITTQGAAQALVALE